MDKKKRGPGRPPRRILPPLATKGIVDTPEYEDNIMEFCYYDPMLFKNLFSLCKNLKVREIYMVFNKDSISFVTQDHIGNRLIVNIDCQQVLHYYCKEPCCVSVNKDNILSIFANLDKTIDRITFSYEVHDDMLQIRLDDNSISKIENRHVLVNNRHLDDDILSIIKDMKRDDPVLTFSFPVRIFKNLLNSICCYSDRFKIEKHGSGPLTVTYSKMHTNNCSDEFGDEDKIELVHNITEKQSFTCQLYAVSLKSIAGSINNKVNITCFEGNVAHIQSDITSICSVTIIVEKNE